MRIFEVFFGVLAALAASTTAALSGEPVYLFKEAESFQVVRGDWQAKPWGTNYYAATFANTFLSRQEYLGAPEQGDPSEAVAQMNIPVADTYLVLVRYEACWSFQTRFGLRIEQEGKVVFDRMYGAIENPKIWAFTNEPKPEVRFSWGPVENIVWEGHTNKVELQPGEARIVLYKDAQPEPAARRNVDLVMLTNNEADILHRIKNERYLSLDGLLTQAGDLFVKIRNNGEAPILLQAPTCIEHSPYWVHLRTWRAKLIGARGEGAERNNAEDWIQPGDESPWVEVGSLLDSLNTSGWTLTVEQAGGQEAGLNYVLSFVTPDAAGQMHPVRALTSTSRTVRFSVPGDLRSRRELPTWEEVADQLISEIEKFPKRGRIPDQILFYPKPGDDPLTSRIVRALGINTGDNRDSAGRFVPRDYVDVRHIATENLQAWCDEQKAQGRAEALRIISLGDEIGLSGAGGPDVHERFRSFCRQKGLTPAQVLPCSDVWEQVTFDLQTEDPHLFYYSHLFNHAEGRRHLKERTNILRQNLPNALIGANYSPHVFYWPHVNQWVNVFKDQAMTMPWSEDYMWQIAMTSQQLFGYIIDVFRCGAKYHDQLIYMYIMPHSPGNTPASFRRCFYEAVAHGSKYFNYFAPYPTALAYTENHVTERDLPMWQAMHDVIQEAGLFEDIVYPGKVRPAEVAILLSESSEVWNRSMLFNAEKQHIWMALKHAQLPVDFLIEDDLVDGYLEKYKVLYICDPCIREDASRAIAEWVNAGGFLFATAGAGMQNEFNRPNRTLRELFGIEPQALELRDMAFWGKADLPFLEPMDESVSTVSNVPDGRAVRFPVFLARQKFALAAPAGQYSDIVAMTFATGGNAFAGRIVGRGIARYAGFFPGMAYVKPSIPLRPADRGSTDDSMAHFVPTAFDLMAAHLILGPTRDAGIRPPVESSLPLVESGWIESERGIAVPLINWAGGPIEELTVRIENTDRRVGQVSAVSGAEVRWRHDGDDIVVTMPLEVADLLMLRP